MPSQTIDRGRFLARHAETLVREALTDTRIVAIVGPRQSGKTTLARRIASDRGLQFVSLDDERSRRFANDDPIGFVREHPTAVIDEIQRAPGLILSLKQTVDECLRAGQFIITASVDLFKGLIAPDSLAGRVQTIELLPLSQAEIGGNDSPRFIERAFAGDFPSLEGTDPTPGLTDRVLGGGFPEVLVRTAPAQRRAWLRSYVGSLAKRDTSEIATIGKLRDLRRLIDHAAVADGQLLNASALGSRLGVDSKTVDRWLTLLEQMFLIRRIRAWNCDELKRLVKAPKLQFLDSGLLAALRRVSEADIARDRQRLGPLFKCFVYAEVAKAIALSDEETTMSHYRDKDQVEVDMVMERRPGKIVGIKVNASATLHPSDFRGLDRINAALGERFACGIVLYDGERIHRISPKLFAMPVKMLWEA